MQHVRRNSQSDAENSFVNASGKQVVHFGRM